jgi:multidrug transporter EmrE-like cation transporter
LFAFYLTSNAAKIRRSVVSLLRPERQRDVLWAWNVAIENTGGYLYQRILLAVINSSLMLIVMLLTGIPFAVPLAVFTGFTAAFIPILGTYLAGDRADRRRIGRGRSRSGDILLAWIVIYRQLENYLLEPRLSQRTMDLNPGIALGAALAGGSVGGWPDRRLLRATHGGGDPVVHHGVCHPVRGRGHGADEGRRGGPAGVGLAVTGGRRPGPLTESASFADHDPKRGHSGVSWQGASEPRARDHRASLIPLPRRTYGRARPRGRTHAGRRGR